MTLKEIMERCRTLRVDQQRRQGDTYRELVFYKEEIAKWTRVLSEVLGPAVKPEGVKPTKDLLLLTKDYGGIWAGQTLFSKDFDDVSVIAMLWPWQDGIHVTLKMALLDKQRLEVRPSAERPGLSLAGIRFWLGKALF